MMCLLSFGDLRGLISGLTFTSSLEGLAHFFRGCNPRKSPRCFQITPENKKSAGALFSYRFSSFVLSRLQVGLNHGFIVG